MRLAPILMTDQLITYELDNGLRVYLKEIHTAPIISHWVWYRVGSRNEHAGNTGISHWVEHLQFKGTAKFPSSKLDRLISRLGGQWDAFTHMDWTTYFETLPTKDLDIALELEADRMVNSLYDPDEVEHERTVVISEREGAENNPMFLLGEAVQLAAIQTHPYRHEIGGFKEDLYRISRDELFQHYQQYYQPANASICISGDFRAEEVLEKISAYYEHIPAKPIEHLQLAAEPDLAGEQQVVVRGPGETTYLELAYHAPAASSKDFFGFTILNSLLSGPASLNMFGNGGTSNKTSRLYQALVEEELAVAVRGHLSATIDPYLYTINFIIHPMHKPEEVIRAYDDQIQALQDHLVPADEIARAVKQAKALFAYGSENITNQAFWMGYANAFANYDWYTHYVDSLSEVTPTEVQRIAQKYLNPNFRVVGTYLPGSSQEALN